MDRAQLQRCLEAGLHLQIGKTACGQRYDQEADIAQLTLGRILDQGLDRCNQFTRAFFFLVKDHEDTSGDKKHIHVQQAGRNHLSEHDIEHDTQTGIDADQYQDRL